ncbi:MAG: alpha/beta fold hydrolase [Candidatus Lokiarchaeota archaeon]|nr:alpha/beta fold hydrolase [Candidatus Lokiarchaeota archaeon]
MTYYDYSMDIFVEDLNKLINFFNLQKEIFLCGISLSGMIAQNYVLKYPEKVKALILIASSAKADLKRS